MTLEIWIYSLISVIIISLISLVGLLAFPFKGKRLRYFLIVMVSFSAGALVGDALIHLLPNAVDKIGFTLNVSLYVLLGVVSMFVVEKFIHWHHWHKETPKHKHKKGVKPYAITNLVGDGVHNFIDGVIIGTSYLVAIPLGIATTIAVAIHEIPQEIGDFAVLINGGFTKNQALLFNFISALMAIVGVFIAIALSVSVESFEMILLPIAAGHFIYISMADLIPEMHKEVRWQRSLLQLFFFIIGILIMVALLFFE